MREGTIRVLLLEDNEVDSELVQRALVRAGFSIVAERVDTEEMFRKALVEFHPDVVLSDHSVAAFNAATALQVVQEQRPGVPVIVVSGALRDETAVACMRAGAENYIVKANIARLGPAVKSALEVREPLARLSPRQHEVFRLVAEGNTTREIAERLGLSVKTVETHRGEIMKRLGIHDLVGLVRYAVRVGMVPPGT
jgi:DNA-binding NarL/FixJ family response regulator